MKREDLQAGKCMTSGCYSSSRLASPLQPYLCYVPGDLQQELAYLRASVFPHLDSLCQARGTCFRPVDVQQIQNGEDGDSQRDCGLQEHQACSTHLHQQLKISLDLISSSSSFLCLLGQHLGCCLPEDTCYPLGSPEGEPSALHELEQNLQGAVRGGYPCVVEGKNRMCSLVELEITQAAFMAKPMHCFFYFKDCTPQRDEDDDKEDDYGDDNDGGDGGTLFQTVLSSQKQHKKQRLWDLKSWIINTCLPVRPCAPRTLILVLVVYVWARQLEGNQAPERNEPLLLSAAPNINNQHENVVAWRMRPRCHSHLYSETGGRFFRDLQELEELVNKDWKDVIDQFHRLPEQRCISGYQDSVEVLCHESHIQALCNVFVPSMQTAEVLELLNSFVSPATHKTKFRPPSGDPGVQLISDTDQTDPQKSILVLSGERGCGKSSLAAWWLQNFRRRNPRVPVVPYFCGTVIPSRDPRSMLRQCTTELRKVFYGDLPEWTEGLEDRVEPKPLLAEVRTFTAAAQLGPCVLLLDGLDFLTDALDLSLQEVKELRWLPVALPPLCKLIVTTTSTDLTYKSLASRSDVQIFTCSGISDLCTQCNILRQHLALPCKELPSVLLQSTRSRNLCRLPVSLAILGSELRTCGMQREEEKENELMEEYMEVDSVSELWVKVIHRWVKDYSRPAEDPTAGSRGAKRNRNMSKVSSSPSLKLRDWVWDTLCLLHVSRSGLTEDELLALLEDLGHSGPLRVHSLEWARLRSAFGPWVQQKPNGLLCFSHQSLCQTIELLLMGIVEQQKGRSYFHHVLTRFFQRPREEHSGWLRKLQELPWHLVQTGSFKELHSVLTHPEALGFLSDSVRQFPQLRLDFVHYWTLLSQKGYEPISSLQMPLVLQDSAVLSSEVPPMRDNEEVSITETHTACGLPGLGLLGKFALFSFDILLCLGKTEEAERGLLQAERALQQAGELDGDCGRSLLEAQCLLAKLYIHMQRLEEAQVYCNKGLETANTITVSSSLSVENIRMIKGQLLCFLCQLELQRGRLHSLPGILQEINKTSFMSIHPCAEANVTLLQGLHKWRVGELSAAESCVQAALANRRRWYGSEHPQVAAVEEQLADIWTDRLHSDKDWTQRRAAELYRHVVHIRESVIQCSGATAFWSKPTIQHLTKTLLKLGEVLMQSSCKAEKREALSLQQRAADLGQLLNPIDPRDSQPFTITASPRTRTSSALLQPSQDSTQAGLISTDTESAPAPQEPKLDPDKRLTEPWTAFQTCVFGPRSDIRSLVPREGLCVSRKASSQESSPIRPQPARRHVQEEAVKALNRQMGTPVHRK